MIRTATVEDLPRMEPAARTFYASSRFLHDFNPERFRAVWAGLLRSGAGVIFTVEESGSIVGAIGGVAYPDPHSGALVATEFFWFIAAGYRGPGMELYRRFEAWAREQHCGQIRMVHLVDSMPEKLDRVYRWLGFEPAEVHYTKELP